MLNTNKQEIFLLKALMLFLIFIKRIMLKYTQIIGLIVCVSLIGICFLPWSIIEEKNLVVSGMRTTGTAFGRPGLLNIFFCSIMIVFFALTKVWAKRANVFIATIHLAWCIRNYILISACQAGECPQKQWALYVLELFGIILLVCALFPKMDINTLKESNE